MRDWLNKVFCCCFKISTYFLELTELNLKNTLSFTGLGGGRLGKNMFCIAFSLKKIHDDQGKIMDSWFIFFNSDTSHFKL